MTVSSPYVEYRDAFREQAVKALSAIHAGIEPSVEVPKAGGADFCVICFPMAKVLRMAPDKIASALKERMGEDPRWKLDVAGGYLNCTFDPVQFAAACAAYLWKSEGRYGSDSAGGKVTIEHTSANPNGPFHVGRARNPIIGDTLVRMFRLDGNEVEAQYWVNDVGKQVMILLWGMANIDPSALPEPERDKEDHRLVRFYQEANRRLEGDPSVEDEVNSMLLNYENAVADHDPDRPISSPGHPMIKASEVRVACDKVLAGMVQSLSDLNVIMDSFVYESAVVSDGSLKQVVSDLRSSPLCRNEGGALYLDLSSLIEGGSDDRFKKRFVFTRSDGSALYTTRDLAYHRWKLSRADVAINVLGEDHKYQSTMLRLALGELHTGKEPESVFYSFVSLPEGKMSTRRNRVVFLDDLLEEAVSRAKEEVLKRRRDLSEGVVEAISRKVGIGALRFNMIRVQPEKQIVFRWEEALNFEGSSAPFVQYSHARACSILEKAGYPSSEPDWGLLLERSELQLAKKMAMFPEVLSDCVRQRKPHLMANFMVEAASSFSDFYRDCPVLLEYNPERRLARIGLCRLVKDVLSAGLGCLGIDAPETM